MKTIAIVFGCMLVLNVSAKAQGFTEVYAGSLVGVNEGRVAWGDYDNDGDLDIVAIGDSSVFPTNVKISRIYQNTGSGFTEVFAGSLTPVVQGSVAWGDYDNDGKLDILLTGNSGSGQISKIYQNTGSGFTEVYPGSLTTVYSGTGSWGDYDNDGSLDILLTGWNSGSYTTSKIYRNTGSGFTEVYAGSLTAVFSGSTAWGDYDNDGNLDILLSGQTISNTALTKVYRNTGSGFTEEFSLAQVRNSSVAWGDYDNDGDLDILLTGYPMSGSVVSKIYQNTGSGFSEVYAGSITNIYVGTATWGDYDNDGDLDILLTGHTGSTPISKVYQNTGSGFTEVFAGSLTGVGNSSSSWGDYDNDGDLDILLSGLVYPNGYTKIYRNDGLIFNTPPSAPTGLMVSLGDSSATLRWNKSSDSQTSQSGLTYNLRIGTTSNGINSLTPMANVSNGYRRVVSLGNTNHDTSWTIKILDTTQTYYWSVQAIDNAFAGSVFATEATFIDANVFSESPSSIAYGNVALGATKQDSVTVRNTGTSTLIISSILSDSSDVAITPSSGSVAPLDSQKFYISFAPTTAGAKIRTVSFIHNAKGSPYSVNVSGTGVQPVFSASAANIAYGTVNIGNTKNDSVTVRNTGLAPLNITSITSSSLQFSVSQSSATVAISDSVTITIMYAPTLGGTVTDTITFTDNASGSPHMVICTGTGYAEPSWSKKDNTSIVNSLAVTGASVIAGTSSNGMRRSTNNGFTWNDANTGVSTTGQVTAVIDYPLGFFAYRGGIYYSTDDGATWNLVSGTAGTNVNQFARYGSSYIFSGSYDGGIYYTFTPSFSSWFTYPFALGTGTRAFIGNFYQTEFGPVGKLFVGTASGVIVTHPFNSTWPTPTFIGLVSALVGSGQDVFAASQYGVYHATQTTDNGTSWTNESTGLPDPSSIYMTSLAIYGPTLFVGIAGSGVYYRPVSGGTWTALNTGLSDLNVYSLAVSGSNLIAGTVTGTFIYDCTANSALPVQLVDFTATVHRKNVELRWNTAAEQNNFGFEIERRAIDNKNLTINKWSKAGFVEGNGNSSSVKDYSYTDRNIPSGKYSYRLKQIDRDGTYDYSNEVEVTVAVAPKEFSLEQNYPNPFNPTTVIGFHLTTSGLTTLKVYDAIGREAATLVNEMKEAGSYSLNFDGTKLSSGLYLIRLQSGEKVQMKKMLMLK